MTLGERARRAVATAGAGFVIALGIAAAPASAQSPGCNSPGTLSWTGGSGNFGDSTKWSPECEPGPQHFVVIGGGSGPDEITNVNGTVGGMSVGSGVRLRGGALTVLGAFSHTSSHEAFDSHIDTDLTVIGVSSFDGTGKVFLDDDTVVTLNGPGTWTGGDDDHMPLLSVEGSQLHIGGAFTVSGKPKYLEGASDGRLVTTPTGSFMSSADALTTHALNIDDAGAVGATAGRTLTLDETALNLEDGGEVRGPGTTRITTQTSTLTFDGTSEVTRDGELDFTAGVVRGKGTLGGDGRWRMSGGTLDGDHSTAGNLRFITSNAETVVVEGVDPGTGRLHLGGPSTIAGPGILQLRRPEVRLSNAGVMSIEPGAEIEATTCCSPFTNTGTITTAGAGDRTLDGTDLVNSGRIDLTGGRLALFKLRQTSGELWQRGGTLAITGRLPSIAPVPVDLAGGELAGVGTLEGPGVVSAGVVSPGDPTQGGARGTLTIAGAYAQGAGGRLVADVADASHDRLTSGGPAALAGTIQARNAPGYAPPAGTTLPVVRGASRSGEFSALDAPDFASDRRWSVAHVPTGADLVVVPKSATTAPPAATAAVALTLKRVRLKRALAKGLPLTVRPSLAGKLRLTIEVPRSLARRRGLRTGRVGSLSRTVTPRSTKATVKFTRKAARRLRGLRTLKLTVRATLTTTSGKATRTRKVSLR